jgi:hypothetical protein
LPLHIHTSDGSGQVFGSYLEQFQDFSDSYRAGRTDFALYPYIVIIQFNQFEKWSDVDFADFAFCIGPPLYVEIFGGEQTVEPLAKAGVNTPGPEFKYVSGLRGLHRSLWAGEADVQDVTAVGEAGCKCGSQQPGIRGVLLNFQPNAQQVVFGLDSDASGQW